MYVVSPLPESGAEEGPDNQSTSKHPPTLALPSRTFISSCDPGPHLAMLIWSAAATLANEHPSI